MTNYNRGDVVLVEFIFSERNIRKQRPALVISNSHYNKTRQELIIAAITSNTKRNFTGETFLENWEEAGLLYPSIVTSIIQTLKQNMIKRKLGKLSASGLLKVSKNLKEAMGF